MGGAASAASAAAFETDHQERIAAAFTEFDTDSSGSIDVAELSAGQFLLNLPFLLFQNMHTDDPPCIHASVLQRLSTENKGASNLTPAEIKSAASLVLATFDSSQNRALTLQEYVAKWK